MAQIEIKSLTFSFPNAARPALTDIDLSVSSGEFMLVAGISGSGKSTLLRHLKTVLTPFGNVSGEVFIDGTEVQNIPIVEQAAKVGYVVQDINAQIVTDNVSHELAFGLESIGMDTRTMRLRVAELASFFGIDSYLHKSIHELSGGQKQLINLASVMAMQPQILVLDEPVSQLDPIAANDFLATLKRINSELGTTVILSEHRLDYIIEAADRVIILQDGRIVCNTVPRRIGNELKSSAFFSALPAPIIVHNALDTDTDCPITVREGKTFLASVLPNKLNKTAVGDAITSDTKKQKRNAVIEFKNVCFRYERKSEDVLSGMNYSLYENEISCIVGGNGAGKSTMLMLAANLLKPYSGSVRFRGKNMSDCKSRELYSDGCGYLPQDPMTVFTEETVAKDMELMTNFGASEERIRQVCQQMDIDRLMEMHPNDLSGGEAQRCAIAKILVKNPKILLLDEPTKGMDAVFKSQFADFLRSLADSGMAVLIVSHDIEFCARYANRVSFLFNGEMAADGTPRKVFSENSFYTTCASRMSRSVFEDAITTDEVIELCRINMQ